MLSKHQQLYRYDELNGISKEFLHGASAHDRHIHKNLKLQMKSETNKLASSLAANLLSQNGYLCQNQ